MEEKRVLAEPTRLAKIVENWRANVRGVDVAIDQVHDPDRGAAGWVRDLKIAPSTTQPGKQALFARVEWTPLGKELVGGGIFRYMSAEFGPHKDAETGTEYSDVLYAATLTNRPFVKGLAPVTLDSEWVEILREGDFMHDLYGHLSIQADESPTRWLRRLYEGLKAVFSVELREWTRAWINDLPDSSFAVIEPAYLAGETKDKNCRHLPHHGPGGGGESNRNLDLPHLRNAFARAGQIKAVTDSISTEELRRRAIAHLEKHRGALTTETEEQNMDKLIAFLKELGIELAEGADPVDALREYFAKQKEAVATLEETRKAVAMAEQKTAQLAETVAALQKQLAEKDKAIFLDEMTRAGKLLPAERENFAVLYDKDPATVRKLLGERAPKVDLGEHGVSTTKTVPVEDRRLAKMDELIAGGMSPVEAYKVAHREVQ